jgi:hypothetical protein
LEIFFSFLKLNQGVISFALLSIVVVMGVVQWVFWIAGWGRFKLAAAPAAGQTGTTAMPPAGGLSVDRRIRFVIAELFAKLIDDFRHLLALIIVIIFMLTIGYALWVGGSSTDSLNAALQAVTGSFSGIIGVIIGYYFGESSRREVEDVIRPAGAPVQVGTPATAPEIKAAPTPPAA